MSWSQKPLEEVADFSLGKMLDEKKNRGELMTYLANANVRWGEFNLDNLREMRFEPRDLDRYGLQYGDIVMCEGGEPGRCAIWKDQVPGMMIQKALHRIRSHPGLDSRFLFYSFLKKRRNDELSGLFTGSTIKHLPREKLAKVGIDFPPLPIQQRIADTLSAYDDLIENNLRRIALLEEAARLLYREWFVHFRFPGHEHIAVTDGIPEGWERWTLGSVLNLQRGFDLPVNRRIPGGVPVYGSTGIVGEHNAAKVAFPTLVTGRSGSLGKVCFVDDPCWPLNTSLWVTDFKAVSVYFAYFMLSEMNLAKFNAGASVPTLDRKVAHSAKVLVPTRNIAALFDEQVEVLFMHKKLLDQQNQKLAQARDLLLPRLMNVEIAV